MKQILFLFLLSTLILSGQTQIGSGINGDLVRDDFSTSVSMSSDGSIVAIGATQQNFSNLGPGYVRVFENNNGSWIQIGNDLVGESTSDFFTYTALNDDGSILAIGAGRTDVNGVDSGSVYVYENIGGVWTQIGDTINGVGEFDFFGGSNGNGGETLSLSSDGTILAVGAYFSANTNLPNYTRVYENIEGVWTQIGDDISPFSVSNGFGNSVNLSSDGSIVSIAAYGASLNGNIAVGNVSVYENLGGVWTQIGDIITGDETANAQFGFSTSLSSDGTVLAVGAISGNGSFIGQVRVYENIGGVWTQIGNNLDGLSNNTGFGNSVDLNSDGTILAVGAPNTNFNEGAVFLYQIQNNSWVQIGNTIVGDSGSVMGTDVNIDSNGFTLITSSPGANLVGQARIYDFSSLLSIENFSDPDFTVYPNPTKNQFTIQLDNSSVLQNVNIYNNLGQQVLTSKNYVVDTHKLASGLYIIELETNMGKGSKKLIID